MDFGNSDSGALLWLPAAENRTGGILNDCHAAGVHDVECRSKNFAAELLRFRSSCIGACDGDVNHPVRGNPLRALFGTQSASGGGFAALEFEFRVEIVRAHRIVVGFPAK